MRLAPQVCQVIEQNQRGARTCPEGRSAGDAVRPFPTA